MSRHRPRTAAVTAAMAALAVAAMAVAAPAAGAVPATAAAAVASVDLGITGVERTVNPSGMRLTLTVAVGEAPSPATRVATLRCHPTGGDHPAAAQVCAALVVVGDTPYLAGLPQDLVCPMVHEPVTVTMSGTVDDRQVAFQRTYGNDCVLHSDTGPLFEF